jgi:hypothetical protein
MLLSACGGSGKSESNVALYGRPEAINAKYEVVGKWSDAQGNRVVTVATQMTDSQDLRTIARRFVDKKGQVVCVEFFGDKSVTPDVSSAKTMDEAVAMCDAADSNSARVATYRTDPETGEKMSVTGQ